MRNFVVLDELGGVVIVFWFGTNGGFAQGARLDVHVCDWFGLGLVCVWVFGDHARGCIPNLVGIVDKRSAGQDLRVWVKTRKGYVIVEIVSAAQVDWRCNRRHSRMLRPITVRPDAVRPPSSRRVVSIRWKWCIWA